MTAEQRAVNDRIVEYLRPGTAAGTTAIGGPMSALLRSPRLAGLIGQMVPFFFEERTMRRDATEVAILATARHWSCEYEVWAHRRYAQRYGVSEQIVEAVLEGRREDLPDEFRGLDAFVSQLLQEGDVSDEIFASVSELWGLDGALELVATVGFYSMLAFVLNVDRCPVPGR